jgi:hypothetical protein
VRTINLTKTNAVKCHPRVVDGRLKLTRGFLKQRAVACTIRNHHQAPSGGYRVNG